MQLSRALTFLFGCILTRIILAYLAYLAGKNNNKIYLKLIAIVCFLIGLGFLIIYFNGNETADKQLEVWDDDKKVWWHQLRLLHGILYLLFFVYAFIFESPQSYLFLIVDVSLGLLVWILHHSLQINF